MRLAILLAVYVTIGSPCLATEQAAVDTETKIQPSSSKMDEAFSRLEVLIFKRCFEQKPYSDRLQLLELSVFQDSPPAAIVDLPVRFANLRTTVDAADIGEMTAIRERAQRLFGVPPPKKTGGLQRVAGAAYYVFRIAAYHNFSLAGMYGDIMSGDIEGADTLGLLTTSEPVKDR